jgi:hypothetical protein
LRAEATARFQELKNACEYCIAAHSKHATIEDDSEAHHEDDIACTSPDDPANTACNGDEDVSLRHNTFVSAKKRLASYCAQMVALPHRQKIMTTETESNHSKQAVRDKIKAAEATEKHLEEEVEEDNVKKKTRDEKAKAGSLWQTKAVGSVGKTAVQHDADELDEYERGAGAGVAAKAALDDVPENWFDVVEDSE